MSLYLITRVLKKLLHIDYLFSGKVFTQTIVNVCVVLMEAFSLYFAPRHFLGFHQYPSDLLLDGMVSRFLGLEMYKTKSSLSHSLLFIATG